MPPKVLIHGTGAIGAVYAYVLLKAGCAVTATCRSNYDVAKAEGFHIDSELFGKGLHIRPEIVRSPSEAVGSTPFDYLIVTTKAFPEARTSEAIAPAVTTGLTTIVLMQNGIGIEDEYAAAFPSNPILSCVAILPTVQVRPGHIEMGNLEILQVGTFPANKPEWRQVGELFMTTLHSGGSNATWFDDIQERRWEKLLVNSAWNPIGALTLCRDAAFLLSSDPASDVVRSVMGEILTIAQKLGHTGLTDATADYQLSRQRARIGTKGWQMSMLADVLGGGRMEVEVIVGNPVRIAKNLGLQVPRLEMLYVLAKALDTALALREPGQSLDGLNSGLKKLDPV